jgi:tetratricopeptide (TPR) repeat protein
LKSRSGPISSLLLVALVWVGAGGGPPVARAQDADLAATLNRAVVRHQTGDLEGAAALYEQVLRAVPHAARIRSNLGAVYSQLGRYGEAIDHYRRALQGGLEPVEEATVRQNLAVALFQTGQLEAAAEEARQVLIAQPDNRDTLVLLGDCYLGLGQDQGAVDLLGPAAAEDPDDKAVAYMLGTALLNLDRTGDAQIVMDRVFRDDSAEGHVLLATMHMKRLDYAGAEAELEKALASKPDLPLVNFLYGECLMKRNEWEGAAEAFRRELELDPNHFESNLLLGNLLREEARYGEALEHLNRAARLRPDDLALQFSLGAAYVALDRTEEALPLLETVSEAAPNHLPTHMQLAIVYTKLGRTEDAVREREAAVRLQKEADSRSFQGVREAVSDLLGQSVPVESEAPE